MWWIYNNDGYYWNLYCFFLGCNVGFSKNHKRSNNEKKSSNRKRRSSGFISSDTDSDDYQCSASAATGSATSAVKNEQRGEWQLEESRRINSKVNIEASKMNFSSSRANNENERNRCANGRLNTRNLAKKRRFDWWRTS